MSLDVVTFGCRLNTTESEVIRRNAAAAGIAAINSVANLGGYISPDLVGRLTDLTHSTAAGMYMTAAVVALGAFVVLSVPARLVNK